MPLDMYLSVLAYGESTWEQVKFLQWQGSVICIVPECLLYGFTCENTMVIRLSISS